MKKKLALLITFIMITAIAIPLMVLAENTEPEIPELTRNIRLSTNSLNSFDGQTLNAYQIFHKTGTQSTGWVYTIHDDFLAFEYNGMIIVKWTQKK